MPGKLFQAVEIAARSCAITRCKIASPFLMLALTPPTSLVTQKSALVNDNET